MSFVRGERVLQLQKPTVLAFASLLQLFHIVHIGHVDNTQEVPIGESRTGRDVHRCLATDLTGTRSDLAAKGWKPYICEPAAAADTCTGA